MHTYTHTHTHTYLANFLYEEAGGRQGRAHVGGVGVQAAGQRVRGADGADSAGAAPAHLVLRRLVLLARRLLVGRAASSRGGWRGCGLVVERARRGQAVRGHAPAATHARARARG